MLFFIDKDGKTGVTDMNFLERQLLYCADDIRPLYSLPNPGFGSSRNAGALGISLSSRVARATFWSASAVDLYGLRSTDLARWSARYRRMPQCQARGPLPSGFSGTRCQIHSGRCERKAGLEALGGVGLELDSKSQKSLRERGLGAGFGKHRLRAGLDDDRFVADDVSLGDIPHDQERYQGSHPDRFERTDSGMRVRVSSQYARCEVWLDMLAFEVGAIYIFDKGYIDFARLHCIAASGAFFVTRAKETTCVLLGKNLVLWTKRRACEAIRWGIWRFPRQEKTSPRPYGESGFSMQSRNAFWCS